ncbi:translation initiation factor IF-2, mitochondrial [Diaphorina citri]|uniref:Translation initiation factor IF-2, mitochondrial n=1 Tax=Diaphorina citri TaxID=121845 RepID=A0A3Q0J7A4_DIACI|nr:translation initiation factor IF-2, mitochondrial [Diaphorina citri]
MAGPIGKMIHLSHRLNFCLHSVLTKSTCNVYKFTSHWSQQAASIHLSTAVWKKRKTKEDRKKEKELKALGVDFKPKEKIHRKVVNVWRNMTLKDLAKSMGVDCDHLYEVMMYVDNSVNYDRPSSVIYDFQVIIDIIQKSGMKYMVINPTNSVADDSNGKDVERRYFVLFNHLYEVMMYVDNSVNYDRPSSVIYDFQVIIDIIQKSGMKYMVINPTNSVADDSNGKDVERRPPADPSVLMKRPPVVTIMGHVDHGKTTLLDTLRNTSVVKSEFGGITQHIGAFVVTLKSGEQVTFLDTPGHAAFSNMRSRGAHCTDIVVLVVAADDGVMEQTVESIRMAREAKVPIIVAINKIDKPAADIERTKNMLLAQGITVEDLGGDIQAVPISALTGTNVDNLTEAIVAQAEIMHLKADYGGPVEAMIVESKFDTHRGKLATALVQRGTLKKGAIVVAGQAWAKVRSMLCKKRLRRKGVQREKEYKDDSGEPRLNILLKGDVDGSVEALLDVFDTYTSALCRLDIVHYGVGQVSATDVELATLFNAIIYTFNTTLHPAAKTSAEELGVTVKQFNVIYKLVEDVKEEINAMLPHTYAEEVLGEANVLQMFLITDGKKKVPVAGCRCSKGVLKKNALFKLVRRNEVLFEGKLESMKHLKEEVTSIKKELECGLRLEDPSIEFEPGDTIVCFVKNKVPQFTDWNPPGF